MNELFLHISAQHSPLFVAGLSFVHLKIFDSHIVEAIGVIFILLGIVTFFLGLVRYRRMRELIRKIKQAELKELGEIDSS